MAYVGTPTWQISDQYTLAGILQGESSTVAGQTAVANVMQNRADAGGFLTNPNYSGIMGVALGTNQFQGFSTPSAGAMEIAGNALSGNLADTTLGATYYGAPAPGDAAWLNNLLSSGTGTTIGGNTFSDQQGPASQLYGLTDSDLNDAGFGVQTSGSQSGGGGTGGLTGSEYTAGQTPMSVGSASMADVYGTGTGGNDPTLYPTAQTSYPNMGYPAYDLTGSGTTASTDPNYPGTGDTTSGVGYNAYNDGSVSGFTTDFGDPSTMYGSNPTDYSGGTNAPGYASPDQYAQQPLQKAVVQAGDTQSAGAAQSGAATQAGLQSAASSVTGLGGMIASSVTSAETYLSQAFVVVAVAVIGLVFVAFGLGLFNKHTVQMVANAA